LQSAGDLLLTREFARRGVEVGDDADPDSFRPDRDGAAHRPGRDVGEPYTDPESVRIELVPFQGEVLTFDGPDRLTFEGETFLRTDKGPVGL
jgi:hypothetical protein